MCQLGKAAIELNVAAALARPRANINDSIGGLHDLWVVLDDQQTVACALEFVNDTDEALQIPWVQTDRRLIENKECVDQRGAQGRGEVDALYLTAR